MNEFIQGYHMGKNAMETLLFNAIPHVYTTGFAMIVSGNWSSAIVGSLMMFGITVIIVRGLWKIIASVLEHHLIRDI